MATINCLNNSSDSLTTPGVTISAGSLVLQGGSVNVATGQYYALGPTTSNAYRFVWDRGTNNCLLGITCNVAFNTTYGVANTIAGYTAFAGASAAVSGSDTRIVAIGSLVLGTIHYNTSGYFNHNVFIGANAAGFSGATGNRNTNNAVIIGDSAGYKENGEGNNVSIGYAALYGATNYNILWNVAIGSQAGGQAGGNTANGVIVGYKACGAWTTGRPSQVTAIGSQALGQGNANQNNHVAIGYRAGYGFTNNTEVNNVCIGALAQGTANTSNILTTGAGTGTGNGQLNAAFISGIYNIAVGATCGLGICDSANQCGTISAASTNVLTGATKPAWSATPTGLTSLQATTLKATTFDTNVAAAKITLSGTTIAAGGSNANISITLTPKGAGTLISAPVYARTVGATNQILYADDSGNVGIVTSSLRYKDNILDMGDESKPIMNLRPVTFNYKNKEEKKLKVGLIAEEVETIYKRIVSYDSEGLPATVLYQELSSLLLNEIKKLSHQVTELEGYYYGSN